MNNERQKQTTDQYRNAYDEIFKKNKEQQNGSPNAEPQSSAESKPN